MPRPQVCEELLPAMSFSSRFYQWFVREVPQHGKGALYTMADSGWVVWVPGS